MLIRTFKELPVLNANIIRLTALLLASVLLTGCGRADIDPNDYLELSLSGLDTAASAAFDIDYEKMVMDNPRAFGIKEEDGGEAAENAVAYLRQYLVGAPDKGSKLSNGDIISFEWDADCKEKLEDKYRIRLALADKEITVSGLREAVRFDPFYFLCLDYSGVEPNGELILSCDRLPVKDVPFTASRSSGLSSGDKVTVRFGSGSEDEIRSECFSQGYIPLCFEKEYTVSGVPVYVKKLSDISRASYEKMDVFAREELQKLADGWKDKKLLDTELLGAELYTPAESDAKWGRNALCYVYKLSADIKGAESSKSAKKQADNIEYYYFTCFIDVFAPDSGKGSYPAESVKLPSYSQFYDSFYGDAFKVGDVICEGCRTLEDLRSTMNDYFENSTCETDIEETGQER